MVNTCTTGIPNKSSTAKVLSHNWQENSLNCEHNSYYKCLFVSRQTESLNLSAVRE